MKINRDQLQESGAAVGAQQTAGSHAVRSGKGASAWAAAYGWGSDSVQLSNLSAVVRAYTTTTPERASAVEQLGRDVNGGRYPIDNKAVSQAIITDATLA